MRKKKLLLAIMTVFLTVSINAQTAIPVKWVATPTAEIINVSMVTCNEGNDGSAEVNVTGGTAPYSYLWDNGVAQSVNNYLNAGIHTVTVTDVNCETIVEVIITEPTELTVYEVYVINVNSGKSTNGEAMVYCTGGTSPYDYIWSNGQTRATATDLFVGNYYVTVTDANGCTAISNINVYMDPDMTAILDSESKSLKEETTGVMKDTETEKAWHWLYNFLDIIIITIAGIITIILAIKLYRRLTRETKH